jgi:hypothetical protein
MKLSSILPPPLMITILVAFLARTSNQAIPYRRCRNYAVTMTELVEVLIDPASPISAETLHRQKASFWDRKRESRDLQDDLHFTSLIILDPQDLQPAPLRRP